MSLGEERAVVLHALVRWEIGHADTQDSKADGASVGDWRHPKGSSATVEQDGVQAETPMEHAQARTVVLTLRTPGRMRPGDAGMEYTERRESPAGKQLTPTQDLLCYS